MDTIDLTSFAGAVRVFRRHRIVAALGMVVGLATILAFSPQTLNGLGNSPDSGPDQSQGVTQFPDSTQVRRDSLFAPQPGFPTGQFADSLHVGLSDSLHADSLAQDSLARLGKRRFEDTTYVVYLDSTARMKYFPETRVDRPSVRLFPRRTYPLYASSNAFRRDIEFDSTGSVVTVHQRVAGNDVRIPLSLSLDDYIAERRRYELHMLFADEARRPGTYKARDDLGDLLSTFTQIQIPVPPNPIFSIFGKPEIKLNISGAVDIKAGFRNTKSDQTTLSFLDQSRSEPDFSQEVQVNVNGTVGDKLNILADWNTRRTFEYENQLKIKYTGYEDEVVQSVEAGNVSLQTPSSFIGSSQALFGVKAKFQAGPLTLTALASQKKGQIKEVSVTGGSQQIPFEVPVYNYSTNHYFVDTSYIKDYEPYLLSSPPTVRQEKQILEEEVWVSRVTASNDPTKERQGIAFIDLPPMPQGGYSELLRNSDPVSGSIEGGRFVRLDPSEYELDGDGYIGVLSLNTNVQDAQIVAIAYRDYQGNQYGEFTRDNGDTTLILKMVKPQDLSPRYPVAWRMMLKNIYPIGPRNIKQEGFTVDVKRRINAGEEVNTVLGKNLLNVLGLDRYNADNTAAPEGDTHFDFRPGLTINQLRGEVIFPYLEPFNEGMKTYFSQLPSPQTVDDSLLYPEIYDSTKTRAQQSINNRYTLKGTATGDATSKFSIGFNVVEGSVQVFLNGQPLVVNIDYTVDYIIGEVVIRNNAALVPGANVQIKFEQNDLFQLASKTLLGARGDLSISPKTSLGFTIMNLNQQSLSDKVRLGEEPNNNTIYGIDGQTSMDLPFLTKALDALPILQTHEQSTLQIRGELAYMRPDPNTRKSTIPSDGGAGIAYIDDFEGSRRTIPLSVNYTAWSQASNPVDSATVASLGANDSTRMAHKAKIVWFNRLPTDVKLTDVYPRKLVGNASNNQITVMDVRYFPNLRGQFNYSLPLGNSGNPDPTVSKNWGGIMKPISISATNLIQENISFIEVWMQVSPRSLNQKMMIDLGSISEDVIPNRRLNSEDLVRPGVTFPDQVLQEGEDVGLDMLTDAQEQQAHPDLVAAGISDPSGDDYSFRNNDINEDYQHINGTEGNRNGPGGLTPDTEDLNFNGSVDLKNEYFHYELNLDTSRVNNPQVVGGGEVIPAGQSTGWYQYRIPIRDYVSTVGTPDLERIEFVRIYFENATVDTIALRIADFSLVGNQWEELMKDDSTFSVSVVSVEETPGYTSPPGVIRERDKTQPDQEIYANEQSISLNMFALPAGESRQAVKFYTYRPLDVFDYKTMKMFVHGDEKLSYVDEANHDVDMFFRFGADSLNFYEYRAPVHPGWDQQNEVVVHFDQLTAIKQARDSVNVLSQPIPVEGGPPGATYRVRGSPSLTQMRYLALGVTNRRNPTGPSPSITGSVWFNELRVTSVNDAPGVAYSVATQLKLADLGTVGFNYSKTDPNFHRLEDRFGSRQEGTNWSLNASASLERFLPGDWVGTTLPITYTHQESFTNPQYLPNSDVLVDKAATLAAERAIANGATQEEAQQIQNDIVTSSQSRRVTDTYAAPNFKIAFPSQAWYIRDTFNKLSFGFTYTRSNEHSPAIVDRTAWSWNASIRYALTLPPDYFITPFKNIFDGVWLLDEYKGLRLFFPITGFSWGVSAIRSRDVSLQRVVNAVQYINRNFTASRQLGFQWKLADGGLLSPSGDYNLSIESSLRDLELDRFGQQRAFSDILNDIFFGDKLVNFGKDTRYTQRYTFNTKPNIPNIFNIKKYLDLSFQYSVDYNWQNTLQNQDIGKSAGFNNSINFSTNLRLKALFDPLFEEGPAAPAMTIPRGRRGAPTPETPDTTSTAADTTSESGGSKFDKILSQMKSLLKVIIKTPLLDYETVNISFSQSNQASNTGVVGRTGFGNFWAVPFVMDQKPFRGPSRLYQLGLISDPSGELTNFGFRPKFPFFGWDVVPGIRAASYTDEKGNQVNANLTNVYRQTNRLSFKTNRALWEGARIDLSWNIGWTYNRTQTVTTDAFGYPTVLNSTVSGSVDRSFLTFPDFLFLGVAKSGLKYVKENYAKLKNDQSDTRSDEAKLTQAFEEGFEAFPWLRKLFGQYYPRVNWSLRWDGLEKFPLFSKFVSRLSLEHSYNGNYTRTFRTLPTQGGGSEEKTDGQRVTYGFSPLIGLNFTFKELFKGNFGANLRYNTTTSFDLSTGARSISQTVTQELSITASYGRRGFEIPLFGLSLNNDIDVLFSYSISSNSRTTYDVAKLDISDKGEPLDGSTRTVMEPRIKYVLSSRVNASVYYRYTSIKPDAAGSRIPGSTTNEAGLDLHISIQ